jgi:hypothetical protein
MNLNKEKKKLVLESSTNYKTNQYEASSFKVVHLNPKTSNFNLIKEKTKKAVEIYLDYLDQPNIFLLIY